MPELLKSFYPTYSLNVVKYFYETCENLMYSSESANIDYKNIFYNEGDTLVNIYRPVMEFSPVLPYRCKITKVELVVKVHDLFIDFFNTLTITGSKQNFHDDIPINIFGRIESQTFFTSVNVSSVSVDSTLTINLGNTAVQFMREQPNSFNIGMYLAPEASASISAQYINFYGTSSDSKAYLKVYYTRGRQLGG